MADKTQQQQTSLDQFFNDEDDFSWEENSTKKPVKKVEKKEGEEEDVDDRKKKNPQSQKGEDEGDDEEEEVDENAFDDFTNDDEDEDSDKKPSPAKKDKPKDKEKTDDTGKKKTSAKTDDDEEDAGDEEEDDVQFYTNLTKELKKKGVLSFIDLKENEEIDEDRFFELQDEELDARLDAEIDTLFKNLDPEATALIKHIKSGGRTRDFLRVYGQPTFKADLDLTVEKNRKAVITTYLREVEGLDDEEVEERLEFLKDGAKMEKYAKRYHTYFVEKEEEDKAALKENTEKARQRAINQAKKFKSDIETFVNENEEAFGIPIPPKDKKKLIGFITDASIKTDNGFRTPFQIKLDALYKTDEKLIAFANLLMNDFKLNGLKEKAGTEKVKSVREVLRTGKDSRRALSSAPTRARSSGSTIADLL